MFGGKVNETDVYSYKPMYGGRWTTSLNDLNDRYLVIIKKEEYRFNDYLSSPKNKCPSNFKKCPCLNYE